MTRHNGHAHEQKPTHAWLRDPLSGIVHLVRGKDGHACCAPQHVKQKPSCTRWQVDDPPDVLRRCGICTQWMQYYVSKQQQARKLWAPRGLL